MTQILSAVTYMHGQHIIHKDIKPENIVIVNKITSDNIKDIQLKFIDFGISIDLKNETHIDEDTLHGTLYYMPPESMHGKVHLAWDVWSCGIICYMLATKKMPYQLPSKSEKLLE
jgi:calcium-dependent protein kinase